MRMKRYLNMREQGNVETIDSLDSNDFKNLVAFRDALDQLRREYLLAGMNVYISKRATKEWYSK